MSYLINYSWLISWTTPFAEPRYLPAKFMLDQTRRTMSHPLLAHKATACFIVLQIVLFVDSSVVSKAVCRQRQIQPPEGGQRCVSDTEVYINTTGARHHCMWLCMQDPNCQVINFNIIGSYCLIGERPCISVENDTDFVTTIMSMKKPSLKWITSHDGNEDNLISFLQAPDLTTYISIARCIIGNNKIPGKWLWTQEPYSVHGPIQNGGARIRLKTDPFSRVQHQLGALRFRFRQPTSGWYRHWRSIEWCPSLCCPEVWSVPRWFSIKICFGLLQPRKRARPFRIPIPRFYFSSGWSPGGSGVVCDLDPDLILTIYGGTNFAIISILSDLRDSFSNKNTTRHHPCATNNGYGLARINVC